MQVRRFKALRIGLTSIAGVLVVAVTYSVFVKYEETTFVSGVISSDKSISKIKSPISAQVKDIKVKVNEKIERDEIIVNFDCTSINESVGENSQKLDYLRSAKLTTERNNEAKLRSQDLSLESTKEYIETYKMLVEEGAASKLQLKDYELKYAREKLQRENQAGQNIKDLMELDSQIQTYQTKLATLLRDKESCSLPSPLDGVVANIKIAPFELVNKGNTVAEIYKDSRLLVELNITSKDIPLIEEGESFKFFISTYNREKYGYMNAKIVSISPLTNNFLESGNGSSEENKSNATNTYLVRAKINEVFVGIQDGLEKPEIKNGMPVTALFTRDDRRLIYVFSDQLVKIQDSIKRMKSRF